MQYPLGQAVSFSEAWTNATTGAVLNLLAGSFPSWTIYEEGSATAKLTGTMTARGTTGTYYGTFTPTAANGFTVGKNYFVVCVAATNLLSMPKVTLSFRLMATETTPGVSVASLSSIRDPFGLPSTGTYAANTWGAFLLGRMDVATSTVKQPAPNNAGIAELLAKVAEIIAKTNTLPAAPAAKQDILDALHDHLWEGIVDGDHTFFNAMQSLLSLVCGDFTVTPYDKASNTKITTRKDQAGEPLIITTNNYRMNGTTPDLIGGTRVCFPSGTHHETSD